MTEIALLVRPFAETDEPSVIARWTEVFADDPPRSDPRTAVRRKLHVQRELFLVGEADGEVIGTVVAGFDGYRGWVHCLAVHPLHHRRGFGRALMRETEARLRAIGCPKLGLQLRSSNADVVAFYRRLGYAIEDRASLRKSLE